MIKVFIKAAQTGRRVNGQELPQSVRISGAGENVDGIYQFADADRAVCRGCPTWHKGLPNPMVIFSTESGKWAVGNPSQLDDNSHYLVTDTKHFCFWPNQMKLWGRRSNGVFEPLNQVRVLQDYAMRKPRMLPNNADNEERDRARMPLPAALPARLLGNQSEPAAQAN